MSYRTEQEQLDLFKKWWSENGQKTLLMVLAILLVTWGGKYWQDQQHHTRELASNQYLQWLSQSANSLSSGSADPAVLETLREQYGDTFYGQASLLFLAQQKVQASDLAGAEALLAELIEQRPKDDLLAVARLRSARVLLAMGDTEKALQRVAQADVEGFESLFYELRGDIHMASGRIAEARSAYEEAVKHLDPDAGHNGSLEIKQRNANSTPITAATGE